MYANALEQSLVQPILTHPERRASPRIHTVFFIVKVTRDADVGLFRVRNISDTGMMLAAHVVFEIGELVLIELSQNLAVEGAVEWCADGCCGIKFNDPIDCAAFLRSLAAEKHECRRNARRLPLTKLATAYSECGVRAVKITDVSPRGVGLIHDGTIRPGTFVKLVLESGVTRTGAVCWSRDGHAGVLLNEPFAQVELESARRL